MAAIRQRMPIPLCERDPSDPARRAAELAQRGRMILDVSLADLEAAESALGAFHPTAWYFRTALHEAQLSWDRLRAEFGRAALETALNEPPLTILALGDNGRGTPRAIFVPIAGQTYRVERIAGSPLAPIVWRLSRLSPPLEDGPYYACRLREGTTQCDCAEWIYQIADSLPHAHCKHLRALAALGWI